MKYSNWIDKYSVAVMIYFLALLYKILLMTSRKSNWQIGKQVFVIYKHC